MEADAGALTRDSALVRLRRGPDSLEPSLGAVQEHPRPTSNRSSGRIVARCGAILRKLGYCSEPWARLSSIRARHSKIT